MKGDVQWHGYTDMALFCPIMGMSEDQLYDEVYFLMRELHSTYTEVMSWTRGIRRAILKRHIEHLNKQAEAQRKNMGMV